MIFRRDAERLAAVIEQNFVVLNRYDTVDRLGPDQFGYADSALGAFDRLLRGTPNGEQLNLFRGLVLAYLGRRDAAVQAGERGLALGRATKDQRILPYLQSVMARLYLALGDKARALDQLDAMLAVPHDVSPAWLRIEPTWASLRNDERFARLTNGP